jgi:photosystem I reaction center subunit XII
MELSDIQIAVILLMALGPAIWAARLGKALSE